tara:strand:- start:57 stop:737 length:681 start_codon:yes stop_codon:yes gene_type:complete
MKDKFYIVEMPKYAILIFILLSLVAMYLYPGGTLNNPNQEHYSFIHNFFSDLGTTVSYSGVDNMVSCIIFNSSLCIIGVSFLLLFLKIRTLFSQYRILSIIGSMLGIFSGLCFIGVGLTPADTSIDPHVFFAHWIFRSLFIVSIIYSILIFKSEGFDNKYAFGFIIFGVMVLAYVVYSELMLRDPREFPEDLMKHVVAQKMIVFWLLASIYIYSKGLARYINNKLQ